MKGLNIHHPVCQAPVGGRWGGRGHCRYPEAGGGCVCGGWGGWGGAATSTGKHQDVCCLFFSSFLNGRDPMGRYGASQSIIADAQRERLIAAASPNRSFFFSSSSVSDFNVTAANAAVKS